MSSRRQRIILGVCLSLFTTLITLALAEAAFRLVIAEEQLLDERSDVYWKVKLRRAIEHHEHRSADVQHDPALGWRMTPNFDDKKGIHHNSRGFRGQRELGPKGDKKRVFVIGASLAYGLGMADEQVFSALLEGTTLKAGDHAEVINAGVNAYGADQSLLMWEQEGQRLEPDLVVLVYHVDDYYRNGLSFRDTAKPHFVLTNGTYRLAGVPAPTREALIASGALETPSRLRLVEAGGWLARRVVRKSGVENPRETRRLDGLTKYIFTRLRDSARDAGADLLIVVAGHCAEGTFPFSEKSVVAIAKSLGIRLINMAERMRGKDFRSYYAPNCHWSARGHVFVANALREALEWKP